MLQDSSLSSALACEACRLELLWGAAIAGSTPQHRKEINMKGLSFLTILLLGALALVSYPRLSEIFGGEGSVEAMLLAGHYYKASLPPAAYNVNRIIDQAKSLGFWIRIERETIAYYQGSELCLACDPAKEREFFTMPQLYVDGNLFLIRIDEVAYKLITRPKDEANLEIIIAPKQDITTKEAEEQIIAKLLQLGVICSCKPLALAFEPLLFPQEKLAPPEGVKIDSLLYKLTLAPDWHEFAETNGFELFGLRVKIIIELVSPEEKLQGDYKLILEARSDSLIRARVLVNELVNLAKDPAVKFVRLPYKPEPTRP